MQRIDIDLSTRLLTILNLKFGRPTGYVHGRRLSLLIPRATWLGYTRALHILFQLSETQKGKKYLSVLGEKPVTNGFVFVGILLFFWLGLVPQVLTPLALRMVENLAQLLV